MSCLGASGRLRTEGVPHTYTGCKYSRCVPLKLCVFCFPDVVITRTIRDGRGERKLSSPTESGISLIIVILRLLLLPVIIRCDPLESLALLFPSMSQAWELLCPRCQPVPLDDKGRKGKLAGSPTVNKTRHWVHRACQGGVVMPPRHSDYWRRCCRVFGNKQVLSKWLSWKGKIGSSKWIYLYYHVFIRLLIRTQVSYLDWNIVTLSNIE